MLAKILEDMWVEPEVLEALSEEQKRILFLKMREEQVRRWREREEKEETEETEETEEKEERENGDGPKKAADNKHVRWLLGRDGDVSVIVIGEVDEFRSSKLLQRLMNDRVQTADSLSGREAQELSEEDPAEDSDGESGGSSDNHGDWTPLSEPHLCDRGERPPLRAQLSETEGAGPQDAETSHYGGRVAQLRKAFAEDPRSAPANAKPPVPTKPAHLQKSVAPSIPSN
ncbi:SH2 domain-containing protein 4B [Pseudoliparis swirei]|uniref:SH2 domain-containing protein 4B n=1 Tax=Pseudoliparis swirei TaxID=2059687 RepID=UPI0024BE910A|nr:SH2 domain-containing protein 4B [Pseudoliparis swirei]